MISAVHTFLDEAALQAPAKTAVITDEGGISYERLASNSRRLANWLSLAGVKRGDRVVIILPNGIPVVTALMAISRIGAIYCIVNQGTKKYHLAHILEDAEPALIITTRQRSAEDGLSAYARVFTMEDDWDSALACDEILTPFPGISSDIASLIYTSGSTGKPKAVVGNHRSICFAVWAIQERLQIQSQDVIGNFLPLSFDYGLFQIFLAFQAGATLALGAEHHAGPALLRKLNEWEVTGLPLVPNLASTVIRLARRAPAQLPPLRFITNTGAHLPRAYIADLQALLPECRIFVMFGLTECKRVSIMLPEEYADKPDTVGRALPDTECLIVGPEGDVLPPGEIGELVVRGPHVMQGYWRSPELTAKRFRPWGNGQELALFSGDMCSMDADGFISFAGRTDDIFKQGGYRVSATEIEAAALDVPGVRQAALVLPGEGLGAVLFVTSDRAEDEILADLRIRLEDNKVPPQIRRVDEFPLNTNGKTDKAQLKAYLMEAGKG